MSRDDKPSRLKPPYRLVGFGDGKCIVNADNLLLKPEEVVAALNLAPSAIEPFYCAAGGCESQCTNCADEAPHVYMAAPSTVDAPADSRRHERRVVGHASGWQEQMNMCICGKPWPCLQSAAPASGETPRTDDIKRLLEGKYPPSEEMDSKTRLLYYMEAAECYGQECADLERENSLQHEGLRQGATKISDIERELSEANERAAKAEYHWEIHEQAHAKLASSSRAASLSDEEIKALCNRYWITPLPDCFKDMPEMIRHIFDLGRQSATAASAEARRLKWLEDNHTLHKSVEILYVVDGYQVTLMHEDGFTELSPRFEGHDLASAIDTAMAAIDRTTKGS